MSAFDSINVTKVWQNATDVSSLSSGDYVLQNSDTGTILLYEGTETDDATRTKNSFRLFSQKEVGYTVGSDPLFVKIDPKGGTAKALLTINTMGV
jgi:hypothetical protein